MFDGMTLFGVQLVFMLLVSLQHVQIMKRRIVGSMFTSLAIGTMYVFIIREIANAETWSSAVGYICGGPCGILLTLLFLHKDKP
jgi:hypothetical protein